MSIDEIVNLIQSQGREEFGVINSDGEFVYFSAGDEEYVFDNEVILNLAKEIQKLCKIQ